MKKITPILVALLLLASGYWLFRTPPAPPLHLKPVSFADLPGWKTHSLKKSFAALKRSCAVFMRRDPERSAGTSLVPLKVGDWLPACQAAQALNAPDDADLRAYFKTWFSPYVIQKKQALTGLFTGYYALNLQGSREKTDKYQVPLYALPRDLLVIRLQDFDKTLPKRKLIARVDGHALKPYYTRAAIAKGAIADKATPIAWIESPVDRLSLEIEGSGVIQLDDGGEISLGYAGENGAPYSSIASVLIAQGKMTHNTASMQRIKQYLETHVSEQDAVLNLNQSFVFFEERKIQGILGAQGIPLTNGYSMAVDLRYIPLGLPLWLSTEYTDKNKVTKPLQRMMIAQDTGGAIRGPVRGDVFWGDNAQAATLAGQMRHHGQYWLLLPKVQSNDVKITD